MHHQFGPVPNDSELGLTWLKEDGYLIPVEEYFSDGDPREKLKAASEPAKGSLSSKELKTLERIYELLGHLNASQASHLSYEMPGWKNTSMGGLIKYEGALDLGKFTS